jgi:hypothetical protein
VTPEWFRHQSWGSTVTFQLSSDWANNEFLGFSLCAVIAFRSFSHNLKVKCTYHFHNKQGDSHDCYFYLYGWYDEKCKDSACIFVGFDPFLVARKDSTYIFVGFDSFLVAKKWCLAAKKDYIFSEYNEVSVEFQPEDMQGNFLPLNLFQVLECGVRLLHVNDGLEAMFQEKRERFPRGKKRSMI